MQETRLSTFLKPAILRTKGTKDIKRIFFLYVFLPTRHDFCRNKSVSNTNMRNQSHHSVGLKFRDDPRGVEKKSFKIFLKQNSRAKQHIESCQTSFMACPCCSTVPLIEPGASTPFLINAEVLDQVAAFQQQPGLKTKALKNLVCGVSKLGGVGGTECREEGGCVGTDNRCPLFAITSLWYRANLPFLKEEFEMLEIEDVE